MPPAARVGDHADPEHDGEIDRKGVSNIWVDGQPLARMSDRFRCAATPPAGPHGPNFLISGSASVIANFQPAARTGDTTGCGATLFEGSPTVLIEGPAFGDESAIVDGITIH